MYIVGTPIGNLQDISLRVENTLKEVDAILVEDTRVSIKLLSHLGISKTLISCHDFNEETRAYELKRFASQNKSLALISDAGMPLVSDPGYKIVKAAIELGMELSVIPGPSSVLLALVGSGLPCHRFVFEGFLPDKTGERRAHLEKLRKEERTIVIFLPLKDLEKVCSDILEIMGNRDACLCRELSKLHEEYIRKSVAGILSISKERELKGEAVLVLAGNPEGSKERLNREELQNKLSDLLQNGARLKDAASLLAKESGLPASEIYQLGLGLQQNKDKH